MRINKLSLAVLTAVTCSSQVFAAGFQINEHSANGLGRAFAGQAATPENASVLATNPAAMTQFNQRQISATLSYIDPELDIIGEVTTTIGATPVTLPATEHNVADGAFVPALFYTAPVNEQLSWGLGIFANYGLSTDYSEQFNALNFADYASVKTVTFNPAIAYKISPELSVGFGLNAVYGEAEIKTSVPAYLSAATGGALPANGRMLALAGDDWAYGWNAGVFYTPAAGTHIALSYRGKTDLNLAGDIESDLVAALNQGGQLTLPLPAIAEFAVDQAINDKLSVQFSLTHTQWSAFKQLEAELDSGLVVPVKEENFESTLRGALGVTYQYSSELTLRAGYAYDDGAVSIENRTISIPDTDRQWFTLGASYKLSNDASIDFAYGYLQGREAKVHEQQQLNAFISSELNAIQHAEAHVLSVQYSLAL